MIAITLLFGFEACDNVRQKKEVIAVLSSWGKLRGKETVQLNQIIGYRAVDSQTNNNNFHQKCALNLIEKCKVNELTRTIPNKLGLVICIPSAIGNVWK